MDMYLPALPALRQDLGTSASLTQLTPTACLTGLALGQAIAGPLSDRHGRRRPLLAGTIAYALISALCATAPRPACSSRPGWPMSAYISGSPFIVEDACHQPPLIFSLIFAVNGLGIIVAGQVSAAWAPRYGPSRMLTAGLVTSLTGASAALTAAAAGLGLWGLLPGLFLVVAAIGLILPNSASLALSAHPPHTAGTASALLGPAQFGNGAIAAPLPGIAGPRTAPPMTLPITALALTALTASQLARSAADSALASPQAAISLWPPLSSVIVPPWPGGEPLSPPDVRYRSPRPLH